MKIREALKSPGVRIPLVMAGVLGMSLLAVRACRSEMGRIELANQRQISFMRLLLEATWQDGKRIERIGDILVSTEVGGVPVLNKIFLRDYAQLPEFFEKAPDSRDAMNRLGEYPRVLVFPGKPGDRMEILWQNYIYRVYANPEFQKDAVVFAWPLETEEALMTLGIVSGELETVYYTASSRYSGPLKGPVPDDLWEKAFSKSLRLVAPEATGSREEFMREVAANNGRLWAARQLPITGKIPAITQD
jgi:hypothetical protein